MENTYILVVEDNALTRQAIQRLLEAYDYQVAATSDGREALAFLGHHPPPALILLDLDLPVLSGREFRQRQRKQPSLALVPVIAVSGEDDLAQEAETLCLDGFVQKPFDGNTLLQAVRQYGTPGKRKAPASSW